MHKSMIILIVLFFNFDLSAGKRNRDSEIKRLAALGIDYNGSFHEKKKRQSFDSGNSVAFDIEKYLLKKCKQLQRENDVLRSKLATSPEELNKGGEPSNSGGLSLNREVSSSVSPMTLDISHSELSQVTPPIAISCQKLTMEEKYPYVESPCGPSRRDYYASSCPETGNFLLGSVKPIHPLVPYYYNCP